MADRNIISTRNAFVITTTEKTCFIGYGFESPYRIEESIQDAILFPRVEYAENFKANIIKNNPRTVFTEILPIRVQIFFTVKEKK